MEKTFSSRAAGRGYFWLGAALSLLGVGVYVALFALKWMHVPWYAPVLATLGAGLIFLSLVRRRSIWRVLGLVLFTLLAAFEWHFLLVGSVLPRYDGPARPGAKLPAFTVERPGGGTFTENDLETGTPTALVFFRGRW